MLFYLGKANKCLMNKTYLAVDLKSFFASVECIERNLNPYTTALAVAETSRKDGAMTLAVTPYLKSLGVKSRGRVFEISKSIKNIMFVSPRLDLYTQKSNEVMSIIKSIVSPNDVVVYSIDEVFIDATSYLKYYNVTDIMFAKHILESIEKKTKLTATCGIGPNIFMSKVCMDIDAKNSPNFIGKWTMNDVDKLQNIYPLSKIWGIGTNMERNLNNLGIKRLKDINKYDESFYVKRFGTMGKTLYERAYGIDHMTINDYKKEPLNPSTSISQILYKDYNKDEILVIIKEMCSTISMRIRKKSIRYKKIGFGIRYSKEIAKGFFETKSFANSIDDEHTLYKTCIQILNENVEDYPIRKVIIGVSGLEKNEYIQINLFGEDKNYKLYRTIDNLKDKYGKNIVLNASSLLDYSTIKERNKKGRIN